VLLGFSAACSDLADQAGSGVVLRDSAGVAVVENLTSRWGDSAGWHVTRVPLLSLGAREGDPALQFAGIADAARLSNGTIVVADGRSAEVRFFAGGGALLSISGGQGEGPGEFRAIERMVVSPGDTVWVYDFALRRFTVLDQRGVVQRVVSLERPPPALGFVGRFADGALLMAQFWGAGRTDDGVQEGLRRDPAALVRFSAAGSLQDTVGLFPGREVHLALEGDRMVMGSPLFARTLSRAVANARLWVGDQASFEIGGYEPDGTPAVLTRVVGADLSIRRQDLDAVLADRLREVRPERRPGMRAFLEEAERPPTRPAYGEFLVDQEDHLWVAAYDVIGRPAPAWYVFAPDGRWLGTVVMPARFRLLQVGDSWVLGVSRDELDVEYVRLYALQR
jgi:hypothetical protein